MDDTTEIRALQRAYASAFDARDPEAFANLFTADAEVVLPNGVRLVGREKLLKAVRNTPPGGVHTPEDGAILVQGEQATGASRFRFEPPVGNVVTGAYEDRFLKTPQGWRIAFRRSIVDGAQ